MPSYLGIIQQWNNFISASVLMQSWHSALWNSIVFDTGCFVHVSHTGNCKASGAKQWKRPSTVDWLEVSYILRKFSFGVFDHWRYRLAFVSVQFDKNCGLVLNTCMCRLSEPLLVVHWKVHSRDMAPLLHFLMYISGIKEESWSSLCWDTQEYWGDIIQVLAGDEEALLLHT